MSVRVRNDINLAHSGAKTATGRYLRRFWHPVYVAENLSPGTAKPIRFAGEDFTLYRGESGLAHVVSYRCPHRGTQLSVGWVEGDCIRCRYHGYRFDGSGQCTDVPGAVKPAINKLKIQTYPTQEYLGLIFAYFGEGSPPPFPHYPEFHSEGVIVTSEYTRRCNYFQNVENSVDLMHLPFAHWHIPEYRALRESRIVANESEWGISICAELPDGRIRINQFGMPNIIHFKTTPPIAGIEWTDTLAWRVPIDDEIHASFSSSLVRLKGDAAESYVAKRREREMSKNSGGTDLVDAVLRGEADLGDTKIRDDMIFIQDDVTQVGQGSIVDRTHEQLGPSDVGVILVRKLYMREIHALIDGLPLKDWRRTSDLQITI